MLQEVRQWVNAAQRVVALTGAGISTESGIPDFRGPQGVWTKNPLAEKLSDIRYYMADPEVRKAAWQSRLEHPAWSARPNAGHRALVELEARGKLHALNTQNIDELHQQAGNSPDKVIEVHGTVRRVGMSCGMTAPMEKALARVQAGEADSIRSSRAKAGRVMGYRAGALVWILVLALLHLWMIGSGRWPLSTDDAHYWEWSRHLDWSYYSKGPLVAYLIAASTRFGGHTEFWVRLPAVFLGSGTALVVYALTRRATQSDRAAFVRVVQSNGIKQSARVTEDGQKGRANQAIVMLVDPVVEELARNLNSKRGALETESNNRLKPRLEAQARDLGPDNIKTAIPRPLGFLIACR